jgi:hypothetical protein
MKQMVGWSNRSGGTSSSLHDKKLSGCCCGLIRVYT